MTTRFVKSIFPVAMLILSAGIVSGQTYPNKPIRIIANEPGSVGDLVSRQIAQGISVPLGQPVIVENRSGGGGNSTADAASQATPDGHTLFAIGSSFWTGPLMRDKLPYNPLKDFSLISMTVSLLNVLVVNPSVPANSVKELIALAKAKPGVLNYGSGINGSSTHLAGALFTALSGANIVRVSYKSTGPTITGLLSGELQLVFASAGNVAPHVKSGKLRNLAVLSAQPSALAPGLPTVAATLPGYEFETRFGIMAPAKTPAAIINRLNREIVRVLNDAGVKERILNAGAEVIGSSPEQFAATMKAEMTRMGKVIKDAGIHEN